MLEFVHFLLLNKYWLDVTIWIKGLQAIGNLVKKTGPSRGVFVYNLSAPELVSWEVTSKCNLRCIHCNVTVPHRCAPAELSTATALRVIRELAAMKVVTIAFEGGEPLLRHDIWTLIQAAVDQRLSVLLLTNGLLLTSEHVQFLRSNRVRIQVSLDASTATLLDQIRGTDGAFSAAIRAVAMCVSGGVSTGINMVASAVNYDDIQDTISLAKNMGVDFIRITPYCPVKQSDPLSLSPRQLEKLIQDVRRIRAEFKRPYIQPVSAKFEVTETNLPSLLDKGLICEAGTILCTILSDGTVVPCTHLAAPVFHAGNVGNQSFIEIWNSEDAFALFRPVGRNLIEECRECSIHNTCRGGCRARAFHERGKIDAIDPYCYRLNGGEGIACKGPVSTN